VSSNVEGTQNHAVSASIDVPERNNFVPSENDKHKGDKGDFESSPNEEYSLSE